MLEHGSCSPLHQRKSFYSTMNDSRNSHMRSMKDLHLPTSTSNGNIGRLAEELRGKIQTTRERFKRMKDLKPEQCDSHRGPSHLRHSSEHFDVDEEQFSQRLTCRTSSRQDAIRLMAWGLHRQFVVPVLKDAFSVSIIKISHFFLYRR